MGNGKGKGRGRGRGREVSVALPVRNVQVLTGRVKLESSCIPVTQHTNIHTHNNRIQGDLEKLYFDTTKSCKYSASIFSVF